MVTILFAVLFHEREERDKYSAFGAPDGYPVPLAIAETAHAVVCFHAQRAHSLTLGGAERPYRHPARQVAERHLSARAEGQQRGGFGQVVHVDAVAHVGGRHLDDGAHPHVGVDEPVERQRVVDDAAEAFQCVVSGVPDVEVPTWQRVGGMETNGCHISVDSMVE
ncbi:uncharacterized protein BcabD6B2_57700 [Babesia caballi]|uniref:Uncharacterized protein n=1 Tax=Babesia caballi TaxID=5871 RepID=A0AAV4M2T1_BABCB|nr:hypothetical protein BcabD6B2_57700 [Babesia caballi]